MGKKQPPTSKQLTLFDLGLEGTAYLLPRPVVTQTIAAEILPPATQEIIAPKFHHSSSLIDRRDDPSPFERESYQLYLGLKRETLTAAKAAGWCIFIFMALVIFQVPVSDITPLGLLKIGSVSRSVLVGLMGWLTVLAAALTLGRAMYMFKKKSDSGAFYQRVLQFSNNPLLILINRSYVVIFALVFLSIAAVPFVFARNEMFGLVLYFIQQLLHFFDPWRATIIRP